MVHFALWTVLLYHNANNVAITDGVVRYVEVDACREDISTAEASQWPQQRQRLRVLL